MVAWATTKFLGQSFKRLEDARLLRGQATFLEDLRLPGVHHVAFARSIHAHARFRVDASGARAIAGAAGVFEASDIEPPTGIRAIPGIIDHPALRPCRQPPLAMDKVRYVGEPIAVVVASSRYAAEDVAAAVTVFYDPSPPATTPGADSSRSGPRRSGRTRCATRSARFSASPSIGSA
jgi:carbon-monoxide dehydrogenase large subunit